jgi:hypothetical protein
VNSRFIGWAVAALAVGMVAVNWFITQHTAVAFGYPGFLSEGRLAPHLFQPFAWWWWQARWPRAAVRPIGQKYLFQLGPMWANFQFDAVLIQLALVALAVLIAVRIYWEREPAITTWGRITLLAFAGFVLAGVDVMRLELPQAVLWPAFVLLSGLAMVLLSRPTPEQKLEAHARRVVLGKSKRVLVNEPDDEHRSRQRRYFN